MKYEAVVERDREEIEVLLRSSDKHDIEGALLSAAYYDPEWRWVQAQCTIGFSKLNSPAHQYPCLRFNRHLAMSPARLEARMDSLLPFP